MTTAPAAAATGTRAGVAVQLLELHRSYGAVRALDGLTLELAPGRAGRAARPVGLRQDHRAARPGRSR